MHYRLAEILLLICRLLVKPVEVPSGATYYVHFVHSLTAAISPGPRMAAAASTALPWGSCSA